MTNTAEKREPQPDKAKGDDGRVSLTQAARIAGMPKTTLSAWVSSGLIEPTNAAFTKPGTGNHRRFDLRDLTAICVTAELRDQGVGVRAMRRIQTELRNYRLNFSSARLALITKPNAEVADVALVRTDAERGRLHVSVHDAPGQFILADIDIAPVYRKAKRALAKALKEKPAVRGRRKGVKYAPKPKVATG